MHLCIIHCVIVANEQIQCSVFFSNYQNHKNVKHNPQKDPNCKMRSSEDFNT